VSWLCGCIPHSRSLLSLSLNDKESARKLDELYYVFVHDFWDRSRRRAAISTIGGRDQPPSFTLSSGEIPWFDVRGEIQRCDRLERIYTLEITRFRPITALYLSPYIKSQNFAARQCERQWLTPPTTSTIDRRDSPRRGPRQKKKSSLVKCVNE